MNNDLKICYNCGANTSSSSLFCTNCGRKFEENINVTQEFNSTNLSTNESIQQNMDVNSQAVNVNNVDNQNMMNNQVQIQNVVQQNNNNTIGLSEKNTSISHGFTDYIMYLYNALLRPYTEFKKEKLNFNDFKVSGLLTLIVVSFIVIVNLIRTMYNYVRVSSFFTNEVEWVWENLKEINYLKFIGQNLLVCGAGILILSGVYYLGSLVLKKDVKFQKFLAIVTTSVTPISISTLVCMLVSIISPELGLAVIMVSIIYGYIVFITLVDSVVRLESNDIKIYYHVACLSLFMIVIMFVSSIYLGEMLNFLISY